MSARNELERSLTVSKCDELDEKNFKIEERKRQHFDS